VDDDNRYPNANRTNEKVMAIDNSGANEYAPYASGDKEIVEETQGIDNTPANYWQQTRAGIPSMYINIAIALVIGYFIYQQR
jgi:hypothetical protein